MAQFNPQIPDTNDPNYLGWSKAISDPKPDLSSASVIEGISTGLDATAKGLNFILEDAAKGEAYDRSREIMDQYTGQLQSVRQATAVGNAGTPTGNESSSKAVYDAPTNIMAPDEVSGAKKLPGEIQNLGQNLELLDSARKNGKLSATAYDGRLESMLKDLRAKYPGYREIIDKESERVTGRNAANQQIISLLGDINSLMDQGKELDKAVRTEIINGHHLGIPGMDVIMQKYQSGQLGSPEQAMAKVMSVTGPARTLELQLKLKKMAREERQGVDTDVQRDTEDEANKAAQGQVYNYFNSLHAGQGSPTVAQGMDIIKRANAGEPGYQLSETQADAMGKAIMTQRAYAEKALNDYFDTAGRDGRSIRAILGATKVEQIKKAHLDNFDLVKDLIYNRDYGRAFNTMNTLRAMGNEDVKTLVTDKDLGETIRMSKAFKAAGLDDKTEQLFQGELGKGLQTKFNEFFKNKSSKFVTQPDTPSGVVSTLKGAVEDLKNKTGNASTPQVAMTYDRMINAIEYIADPKNTDRQAKYNLAKAAFDSSNIGLLTKFDEDQKIRNPDGTVTYKPGRYSVFNRLFSREMTKSVKELGGTSWYDYKNLGEHLFSRELFGPALLNLSQTTTPSGLKIGWDSTNHEWVTKYVPRSGESYGFSPGFNPAINRDIKERLDRVNAAMRNYVNIAKEEGRDPDAFLLGAFKAHELDLGKIDGIPKQMRDELIRARTEEKDKAGEFESKYTGKKTPKSRAPSGEREDIRDRALPYSEVDAPSSGNIAPVDLSSWLSNPAGVVASNRNNAPAASAARPRGTPTAGKRRSINLSDQNITDVFYEPEQRYSIGK